MRNDFRGPLYCKTVWPGGYMGERNGQPPGPPSMWVKTSRPETDPRCYPRNMAAVPDLVSNGTYGGGFKFGADGSALTERARQDIATAERLEAAGVWTRERADMAIAAAVNQSMSDERTAARGRAVDVAGNLKRPVQQTTGKKRDGVRDATLDGICGGSEGPMIYCSTRWPYGLVDMKGVTKEHVREHHPHLVAWEGAVQAEGKCPPGSPWWLRAGAWIVRETYGTANDTGEQVKRLTRKALRSVQYSLSNELPALSALAGSLAGSGGDGPTQWWCKTVWPGGWVELPIGQTPSPSSMWAKVDRYGDRPSPPCFPGV